MSIGSRRRLRAFAAVSVIATGVALMVGAAGASAAPAPPDVIYTTATDGTTFATLDSLTGAGTLLGSTGRAQGWAVAMDTDGTMWTTINGFGAAQIATVDKVTGQATPVGSPLGTWMIALEIAPDGTMYGIGYSDRRLYRINKATGAGTLIGADTGIAATMDLAFDCAGRLWATAMGNMWTVDPATGIAVARPSITGVTQGAASVMGLMVDRSCRMYVTTYTSPSSMYELDPATGSATLIGVTGLARPHGGSAGLVVDTQAPATTDDVPATAAAARVTVSLSATDNGSGVDKTYYTLGAAPAAPSTASTPYDPANKPALNVGEKLRYFSVDVAGNAEAVKTSRALASTPPPPAPVLCGKAIVLTDVTLRGRVVRIGGVVRAEHAGRPVAITVGGRVVARTMSAADGTFSTKAKRSATGKAVRYQASVDGKQSAALAAARRLVIDSQTSTARGQRIRGHLVSRDRAGRKLAVDRLLGCSGDRTRRARLVRTDGNGRFVVSLRKPSTSEKVAYYRLRTVSGTTSFTVPVVVRAQAAVSAVRRTHAAPSIANKQLPGSAVQFGTAGAEPRVCALHPMMMGAVR
jgi:antitoxin (DNA-binding transcriptional repressor) of toxin-antitoxin stability system